MTSCLNLSGDESPECPLCMELFELDDINFYPCTCGYQICRFCWNKLRTEGNGLCPACRQAYSENPADFKPLTTEEMARIKAEKRQKDQAKKAENLREQKTFGKCSSRTEKSCLCRWPIAEASGCRNFEEAGLFWEVWEDP